MSDESEFVSVPREYLYRLEEYFGNVRGRIKDWDHVARLCEERIDTLKPIFAIPVPIKIFDQNATLDDAFALLKSGKVVHVPVIVVGVERSFRGHRAHALVRFTTDGDAATVFLKDEPAA